MWFMDSANYFQVTVIRFYHIIVILLIVVMTILSVWLYDIMSNQVFKNYVKLYKLELNYLFNKKNLNEVTPTNFYLKRYLSIADLSDYPFLEAIWVFVPLTFVALVAYPSVGLEYGISPDVQPVVVLKVIASQWYWSAEITTYAHPGLMEAYDIQKNETLFQYSDLYLLFKSADADFYSDIAKMDFATLEKNFDINFINDDQNFYRMLAVDNPIVLPVNVPIKLIITSNDVLHSFAMPSLAIKIDAVPGRLSEQSFILERPGIFWGQCSELCGPYHGFMPVVLEATTFFNYINNMINVSDFEASVEYNYPTFFSPLSCGAPQDNDSEAVKNVYEKDEYIVYSDEVAAELKKVQLEAKNEANSFDPVAHPMNPNADSAVFIKDYTRYVEACFTEQYNGYNPELCVYFVTADHLFFNDFEESKIIFSDEENALAIKCMRKFQ